MQRDYIARGIKVKQVAVFYLDEFYKTMFRWFELNHYDLQEREYRQSVDPKGKHLEIRWYSEKKIDDYIKFIIEIDFLILGLQDIVVEKEGGVKSKTNKGAIEMRFHAYLLKDYEDKWSKTAFAQFLRAVYDKYIIRNRMETYEDQLSEELQSVIAEAKSFLSLHKF